MVENGWRLATRINALRHEMDRLSSLFGSDMNGNSRAPGAYPPLNVWNEGDVLCVEAEIPGVTSGNVEVLAVGNELTIKGRCNDVPRGEAVNYHRSECNLGEFSRTVALPVQINADRIEAGLRNGILTLRLPKSEAARPKRIEVKTR